MTQEEIFEAIKQSCIYRLNELQNDFESLFWWEKIIKKREYRIRREVSFEILELLE